MNARNALFSALALLLFPLSYATAADEAIIHSKESTGLSLTYEIRTADDTTVTGDLTEGPTGWYYVTNTTLSTPTDSLDAEGSYPFVILNGSTVIASGTLYWNGTQAVTPEEYALTVVSRSEPSTVPTAANTLVNKISYIYMMLRNKVSVTSTKKTYYASDDVTPVFEKDLSDDGNTYNETSTNSP